jgi:CBS domain-containing protein
VRGHGGHDAGRAEDSRLADRFLTAWKTLESCLKERWTEVERRPRAVAPDSVQLLRWAERRKLISASAEDFLQSCRQARNAYAHVSFDDYAGPVTIPPRQVVLRLERIASSFRNPAPVAAVAVAARTCAPDTTLREALRLMRDGDFSQLPYCHATHGWLLVTRDQIARWLETRAGADGIALVDLSEPVSALADDPRVGPVVPRRLAPSSSLAEAVAELEDALHVPDQQIGGYPVVLVAADDRAPSVHILAADDLPRAYDLLGR